MRPPDQAFADEKPQHFLNFLPLPQGQGSLRPALGPCRRPGGCCPCRTRREIMAGGWPARNRSAMTRM